MDIIRSQRESLRGATHLSRVRRMYPRCCISWYRSSFDNVGNRDLYVPTPTRPQLGKIRRFTVAKLRAFGGPAVKRYSSLPLSVRWRSDLTGAGIWLRVMFFFYLPLPRRAREVT